MVVQSTTPQENRKGRFAVRQCSSSGLVENASTNALLSAMPDPLPSHTELGCLCTAGQTLSNTKTALPLLQGPHSELVANRVGRQGTLASPGDSGFNDIYYPHPQNQELLGTVYSPADLCHSQLTREGIYCPGLA